VEQNFRTFCECRREVVRDCSVVVVVQVRGKLYTGEAGAGCHGRFRSGHWIVLRLWLCSLEYQGVDF